MKKLTYAITGATGNIGGRVARGLLAAGHEVRVLGREEAKLRELAALGATVFAGQPDDADYLERAFRGADAVFAMIPPHFGASDYRGYQNLVGDAQARALEAAGVKKVVNLSSVAAQHPEGTGVIRGLHDQEERLNRLPGVDVTHLRPAYFMENFLHNVGLIKGQGINGSPARPDVRLPVIATRDIAERALARLLDPTFTGRQVEELLGERDVTMAEVTRVLGTAIGKPDLPYVQFPYDVAFEAMVGMGFSPSGAENMVELYRAMNDGRIRPETPRSPASTTPTSIETFAREVFAPAYLR